MVRSGLPGETRALSVLQILLLHFRGHSSPAWTRFSWSAMMHTSMKSRISVDRWGHAATVNAGGETLLSTGHRAERKPSLGCLGHE